MMHLPISSDNILHFYWYIKTHVLVADGEFLLLIDLPIQDRAQQLQIYEIFNLSAPHGDIWAKYKISEKYIGTAYEKTQAALLIMTPCKWAILQNRCTILSSHKPSNMHNGPIHQEWSGNWSTVLPVYTSYTTHIPTHCDFVKPVDLYLNTHHARIGHSKYMPW